jgi:RNA polymerase sigma factor (TIGR02999 family)
MGPELHDITNLLQEVVHGNRQAEESFFRLVERQLREIAENQLRRFGPDSLLQPTALVNEAYLKIFRQNLEPGAFEGRNHFFALVARAMRQILVDYARKRLAEKRRTPSEPFPGSTGHWKRWQEIVAVNDLLDRLAREDPKVAELVSLRFYGGFSMKEAAEILGVSLRTAQRYWAYGRAQLKSWLSGQESGQG